MGELRLPCRGFGGAFEMLGSRRGLGKEGSWEPESFPRRVVPTWGQELGMFLG